MTPIKTGIALSESRHRRASRWSREIRPSGSMSGKWKPGTVGYSGSGNPKGQPTSMAHLNPRATSRLYRDESRVRVDVIRVIRRKLTNGFLHAER